MAVPKRSTSSVYDDDDDGNDDEQIESEDDLTMDHQETEDTEVIQNKYIRNVEELRNICS